MTPSNGSIVRAAGPWQQIQQVKRLRPWLRYVTVDDERGVPEHAASHKIILPVDHPWWKTHYPPNGFNCHCRVQSLNDRDLVRYNYTKTDSDHPVLQLPPDEAGQAMLARSGWC